MHEHDSKRVLAQFGIPTSREVMIRDSDDLEAAADEIGFPLVLKAVSDDLPHKSDAGLVITGIEIRAELDAAWRELEARISLVDEPVAGVLVQEMIQAESRYSLGSAVTPSSDSCWHLAWAASRSSFLMTSRSASYPLRRRCASMVSEIRGAELLTGFRGSDPRRHRQPDRVHRVVGNVRLGRTRLDRRGRPQPDHRVAQGPGLCRGRRPHHSAFTEGA